MALAAAFLAWLAVLQLPDGRLHVAFLDVGQGDAILITAPQGRQILVDGGPSPSALTTSLGREMPFWDRSIDLVVMTHPDADHTTGLVEALKRYHVDGWLDNGLAHDDAVYAECQRLLEQEGVIQHTVRAGDRLELGSGIVLEVLHPPLEPTTGTDADDNNNSVVLRLRWGEASFLLTGDVEAEAERSLLGSSQPLQADVLKVAHHGSGRSTTAEFLGAVAPDYAVLSVGADNRFGHPHEAVLERLGALGDVTVFRTDEQGTVEFVTDGRLMWVRTEQ
jgi:competence protein ComEC